MLEDFIHRHELDNDFITTAKSHYIPLTQSIAARVNIHHNKPLFIAINGCQGSGKSTLADFITQYLTSEHRLTVVNLSLDDFYLSHQARVELSQKVHPLFATRGVPGTHDVELLKNVINGLQKKQSDLLLPKFNKATDDLYPSSTWSKVPEKVDVVIFEGWCWGASPQTNEELHHDVNSLETEQDGNKIWRNYANEQLEAHYQPLYKTMDMWLMLKAPSFSCVEQWRWQQEEKLAARKSGAGVMNKVQVNRFIQFYQRLTQVCLEKLPQQCHWVLALDKKRNITQMIKKDLTMEKQPLIFTDLDGTLLDHFDYSFQSAAATIQALKKRQIPIIANTSKTLAEMKTIQHAVGLNAPFIIENGAAIYIPIGYFPTQPEDTKVVDDYWVKEFCPPRAHWLELLDSVDEQYGELFQGFAKLTLEELCNLTGLKPNNAELAMQRQYTEPLLWHSNTNKKEEFIKHMESLGANMLQGGRFLHVGGHGDKGLALTWLANVYAKQFNKAVQTIALGDSHNDNQMLEIADIAIQIKSPIHPFPIINRSKHCYHSTEFGPKGWAECLTNLLVLSPESTTAGAC